VKDGREGEKRGRGCRRAEMGRSGWRGLGEEKFRPHGHF